MLCVHPLPDRRPQCRHGRRIANRGSEKGRSNPEQGGIKEEEVESLGEKLLPSPRYGWQHAE